MTMRPCLAALAAMLLLTTLASAQPYEVVTRPDVEYVVHDGVKLTGDLYLPKGRDKAPVLVRCMAAAGRPRARRSIAIGVRISPGTAMRCSRCGID